MAPKRPTQVYTSEQSGVFDCTAGAVRDGTESRDAEAAMAHRGGHVGRRPEADDSRHLRGRLPRVGRRARWAWATPGSLAGATLGLLLSLGIKWYAFHVGDYQKTYGAIGGVIVALLWLYGSGLAILVGAELNAAIERPSAAPRAGD